MAFGSKLGHHITAFIAGAATASSFLVLAHWYGLGASVSSTAPIGLHGIKSDVAAGTDVVEQIREGGYILYFRHGNRAKWDSVIAFDIHELVTGIDGAQRTYRDAVCLSQQGREEAAMIGEVLRLANVPVGFVISSPLCRSRETAELGFGRIDATHMALVHTPVVNEVNASSFKKGLRQVLMELPIRMGTNTVITAHENTIINHSDIFETGREWLEKGIVQEGGMYVISRDREGGLHVIYRFPGLGELAAAGITLEIPARGERSPPK
jgi:hypothetical protein